MSGPVAELARRLARDAEAVCHYYLSNGRRQGRYWTVGDAQNSPGRSLYVRLRGPESGPGAAGKWTDAATGELLRGVWRLGEFGLDVRGAINVAAERERMQKEIARVQQDMEKISQKIASPDFLSRAPEEIIAKDRARHGELLDRFNKLESNLKRLPLK